MAYFNVITNPYSIYGGLYRSIYMDYEVNYCSHVYIPRRKKLKGYQKAKKK